MPRPQGHLTHEGRCVHVDEDNPVLSLGDCSSPDLPEEAAQVWRFQLKGDLWGQLFVSYFLNDAPVTKCVLQVRIYIINLNYYTI